MSRVIFTIDHLLQLRQPANRVPMHVSPDGAKLAVSSQSKRRQSLADSGSGNTTEGVPDEVVGSRVLVVDTRTGEVQEPFPAGSTSWGGQWSPDGTMLAAYVQDEGAACLGVWHGADASYILHHEVAVRSFFGFEVPRWTPDCGSVVVKLVPSRPSASYEQLERPSEEATGHVKVFVFDPDEEDDAGPPPRLVERFGCGLAHVSVTTGEVQRLATNLLLAGWQVEPEGQSVAVLAGQDFD